MHTSTVLLLTKSSAAGGAMCAVCSDRAAQLSGLGLFYLGVCALVSVVLAVGSLPSAAILFCERVPCAHTCINPAPPTVLGGAGEQ